jgi:uncharacterized SAM-binding protein YcdF (DUF218 family)
MISGKVQAGRWWHALLRRLYESLTRSDAPAPADLIFVMAGRMERKPYGLELYRAGIAPVLVLSVGRFEISKMYRLDLGSDIAEKLTALRDKTPPDERHFFVKVDASGVSIEKPILPRWNTYGEILGLRQLLAGADVRRVMIVSTDVHLRRVALTCTRVFRGTSIEFLCCPVPSQFGSPRKAGWWARPDDRRFVIKETMKLAGYIVILTTPPSAVRRLMRLKF